MDDAKIRIGGGDGDGRHNFIQGSVSGADKTLTINKKNSFNTNVELINFSGGATLGTLKGDANIKLAATHEDGSAATSLVYTVENYESSGTMTVDSGVQFNVTNSATISSSFVNNGTTTLQDVTLSKTIENNGTLNVNGNISVTESLHFNMDLKTAGTAIDAYSDGDNGWRMMTGATYYLVTTETSDSTLSVGADTITIGSTTNVALDKTSEAGKISFTYSGASYHKNTTYYANTGISSVNSTAAPSYVIAEGATLKFADSITGEHTYDVTGKGTLEIIVGKTGGHDTKLTMTGFEGVLAISKSNENGNRGNVNLKDFVLGDNASFKLISGNHWSGDNSAITRNLVLAAANESDFQFCHNGTLTLMGKVTGSHLYAGRTYHNDGDNNLTLSGAGSDIANVKMMGGTLTVAADMQFGKVTAPTVVINQGKTLSLGSESSTDTSEITALTLSESSTLKVQHGGTLNLKGTVTGGNGKIAINSGATVNYTGTSAVSGLSSVDIDGGVLQIQNEANTGSTAQNINLKGNGATIQMYQKNNYERNLNISVEGKNNILLNGWGGNGGYVKGTISGAGELELRNNIWNGGPTTDHWNLESTISDKSATEKLAVINATATTTISGANTYSGGTIIESGTLTTANVSALGTGKVTMNGGTLKMAVARTENDTRIPGDLSISAMDYNGGTVNNNGQKLTVTGKLTAAANMTIEGSGDTELGSLDLTAGTTLSTSGSLTIGDLILDLSKYSTEQDSYTLISANGLSFGENVNLSSYQNQNINGFITELVQDDNSLTLNFKLESGPSDSLTSVTVLGASLDGTVLTLNVDADLTDVTSLDLTLSAAALADIKGLTGEVSLALVDSNSGLFTTVETDGATLISNVSFYGSYVGEGQGMYYVQYIPEPASATLSLAALMMLAARRRRRA